MAQHEEKFGVKFLLDGTTCIPSFWLQALILHCGFWEHQLSSHFKDLPVTTDLSHLSLLDPFFHPIACHMFILIFMVKGSNTSVLRAIPVLITLFCSAFSHGK